MITSTPNVVLSQSIVGNQPHLETFSLEEIGIDRQQFLDDICPTFALMPFDLWDQKRMEVEFLRSRFPEEQKLLDHFLLSDAGPECVYETFSRLIGRLDERDGHMLAAIKPIRSRTIAKFNVTFSGPASVSISRVPAGAFIQYNLPPGDPRSAPRIFKETSVAVTNHPGISQLIEYVCLALKGLRPGVRELDVILHQTCMFSTPERAFILPDGVHQDGTDYIVNALPVILEGVATPLSTIYSPDRTPLLQKHLDVGEGLFHDDRYYWHGVSTLKNTNGTIGRRGTFGLDLKLVH